eukprot:comp21866_c0_seq1/m.31271 comp21866_c0_seq1/g.31271  ORF comp21866_c0_seq1/g.31271 comp21866_c0_seq1/m.31271 type:complete len:537 (-) comp21866_c0_seq1:150-1760(-)
MASVLVDAAPRGQGDAPPIIYSDPALSSPLGSRRKSMASFMLEAQVLPNPNSAGSDLTLADPNATRKKKPLMTPLRAKLVQDSWERMSAKEKGEKFMCTRLIGSFFDELFVQDPDTKPIFNSLQSRTKAFTAMIGTLVKHTDDLMAGKLKANLREQGKAHTVLGVTRSMYVSMGRALLKMVEMRMDEKDNLQAAAESSGGSYGGFNTMDREELLVSWLTVYVLAAAPMVKGAGGKATGLVHDINVTLVTHMHFKGKKRAPRVESMSGPPGDSLKTRSRSFDDTIDSPGGAQMPKPEGGLTEGDENSSDSVLPDSLPGSPNCKPRTNHVPMHMFSRRRASAADILFGQDGNSGLANIGVGEGGSIDVANSASTTERHKEKRPSLAGIFKNRGSVGSRSVPGSPKVERGGAPAVNIPATMTDPTHPPVHDESPTHLNDSTENLLSGQAKTRTGSPLGWMNKLMPQARKKSVAASSPEFPASARRASLAYMLDGVNPPTSPLSGPNSATATPDGSPQTSRRASRADVLLEHHHDTSTAA